MISSTSIHNCEPLPTYTLNGETIRNLSDPEASIATMLTRRLLRQLTTLARLLLPRANHTRQAKEISPEEVQRFREKLKAEQAQRGTSGASNQQYYQTKPLSDYQYYEGDPSQHRTVFESPPNPNGIITPEDPVYDILKEPTLVIERQIEMMNIFLGFEQANHYKIMNLMGQQIGYMQERDLGIMRVLGRQFMRLHRPFNVDVFNMYGDHVLTIKRPFAFINSHIKALLPGVDEHGRPVFEEIGELIQSWHLWRRRYNLFKLEDEVTDDFEQFGKIDAPFLSFEFPVHNARNDVIGSVDRNWVGLGREFFTDTGVYIVRMDPASFEGMGDRYPLVAGPLTLDQRAVLLANAVSIDFDYFSRHSRGGPGGGLFTSYE